MMQLCCERANAYAQETCRTNAASVCWRRRRIFELWSNGANNPSYARRPSLKPGLAPRHPIPKLGWQAQTQLSAQGSINRRSTVALSSTFKVQLIQPTFAPRPDTCDKLLVYLPGTDGTGQAILPQIPALRSLGYDVWCLYLPSDDRSDWGQLTTQTTLLLRQLREHWGAAHPSRSSASHHSPPPPLSQQKMTLVAESLGCCLALRLAASGAGPELLDRLVLVNPATSFNRSLSGLSSLIAATNLLSLFPRDWYAVAQATLLPLLVDGDRVDESNQRLLQSMILMEPPDSSQSFGFGAPSRPPGAPAMTSPSSSSRNTTTPNSPLSPTDTSAPAAGSSTSASSGPSGGGSGGRNGGDTTLYYGPAAAANFRANMLREGDPGEAVLRRVATPVLLVTSARDRLLPSILEGARLERLLPNARRLILPDSGHAALLERGVDLAAIMQSAGFDGRTPGSSSRVPTSTAGASPGCSSGAADGGEGLSRRPWQRQGAASLISARAGEVAGRQRAGDWPEAGSAAEAGSTPPHSAVSRQPGGPHPAAAAAAATSAATSAATYVEATTAPVVHASEGYWDVVTAGGSGMPHVAAGRSEATTGAHPGTSARQPMAGDRDSAGSRESGVGARAATGGGVYPGRVGADQAAEAEEGAGAAAPSGAAVLSDLTGGAHARAGRAGSEGGGGGGDTGRTSGGGAVAAAAAPAGLRGAAAAAAGGGAAAAARGGGAGGGGGEEGPQSDVDSAFDEWCQNLAPWRDLVSPVVRGFELLPPPGSPAFARPMLFVGNHQRMGMYDTPLLVYELYVRGYRVRGLAHPGHWAGPVGRWFESFGSVRASPRAAFRLLRGAEKVLLFPGGAREVVKKRGQEYTLLWKDSPDFVRLAARCNALIVPFAAVGADDAYEVIMDTDEVLSHPLLGPLATGLLGRVSSALDPRESVFPITKLPVLGLPSPVPLPNLQRLYFQFASPVDPGAVLGAHLSDPQRVQELYDNIRGTVTQCMSELLAVREADGESQLGPRLARSLQRLVPVLGAAAAPVAPPPSPPPPPL